VRGCHTVLFLECRKRGQDGYLWLGRTSHANEYAGIDGGAADGATDDWQKKHLMMSGGPSVKFHITNIHTMDELKMTGNCMRGSRPVLSFDKSFDAVDHLRVVKHLLVDVFGTPRGHPRSKPFVDRVMGFYYADGKVRRTRRAGCIWPECVHDYKERAYIRGSHLRWRRNRIYCIKTTME
jgi:ribosome biogenesis protein BRX1